MPWPAQDKHPLPQEDLLTWAFDHRTYSLDKPIYHDLNNPSRTISCRSGRSTVRKLIAGFRAAGVQPGNCVCITSFNDIMYSMLFLGLVGAGGIFSGTNPAYKLYEVQHHIRTAEVKFFVVEPELLEMILPTALAERTPRERIFIFNTSPSQVVPHGFRSWEWLLTHGEEDWMRITDLETLKATEIARLTTSGTTGLPKTASQSHHNATSWHTMMLETSPPPWEPRNLYPLP